jgi:aspartate/methionine/tyrosine aminotransferase
MKVWAAAARRAERGLPVFNLTAGQPSTPAPKPVLAAAHAALDGHILGYTEALGIAPLRTAIAGHYRRRYGLDVDPAQVVVTTGSSGGFLLAFLAAFDPGARVGLARPGYPAYRNILAALGCTVVDLPTGAGTRFQPTVAMLDGLDLDGLIVASPANPTGTMVSDGELAALAGYCARHGIRLISDEIYHGISYPGPDDAAIATDGSGAAGAAGVAGVAGVAGAGVTGGSDGESGVPDAGGSAGAGRGAARPASAWATDRSGFVVNSFSKYFSMTGWRIGWLLVPRDLAESVDALAGNLAICPPAPAQYAALAAFDADSYAECDAHVQRYSANRELLIGGLRRLGIDRLAPADGAFYLYADVSHLLAGGGRPGALADSEALCWDLLERAGVATAPGRDFDPVDGGRYLRMSFAGSAETLQGALDALRQYLA